MMHNHSKTSRRQRAERRGRRGERIAALWLMLCGYRICQMRYRNRAGEIDIIARRGKWLIFVEVKARAKGASAFDVSRSQADRMIRAANLYLAKQPLSAHMETRFDLVLLGNWRWPQHIQGAFFDDSWGGRSIT